MLLFVTILQLLVALALILIVVSVFYLPALYPFT